MFSKAYLPTAGLLFLLLAGGSSAEIFRWVDEAGRVHYSDQIPPNTEARKQTVNAPLLGNTLTGVALRAPKPEPKQKKEPTLTVLPPPDPKKCAQAQSAIKLIQSGRRLRSTSASGEMLYLTEEDKASRVENAKKAAEVYCK